MMPHAGGLAPDQPATDSASSRTAEEHLFRTHDGSELFYRKWPARGTAPKGAIVLLHRGHEHGGRVEHLVSELGLDDFAYYAWDARGHGRSPGPRGHSPSFAASIRDLDSFVGHIGATDGFALTEIAVVAQSVGAVLAASWVHDYAPPIRALILASPAFSVKLYVPFARQGIAAWQKLKGQFFVNSYVKAKFLTHDPDRIASFEQDPLITRPIASNILLDLYSTAERIVADARAIIVPTQLLISGSDFVVRHAPQHRFFENLAHPLKERHVLKGFFHDTLGEKDRAIAIAHVHRFITERFAAPPATLDITQADLSSFTRDEADRLASPHDTFSAKGFYWASGRAAIRCGGLFSEGLRTGTKTGFDSGSTLDYVYRNDPRGMGPVGRLVDKQFLNAIGWRGIRQRKLHLEELIGIALARLEANGRTTHILDIAAGHGRYIMDAIAKSGIRPDSIRLQDYSSINVDAGTALIGARGLEAIASFHRADAFDGEALSAITPAPDLAIVSGLYELFPENAMIRRSLDGLAGSMRSGSILLYTNQPWHPQLEMIGRTLTSHRGGEPWIMRRRTQAEMDQLVAASGFVKREQRIDEWGIFTVSLAERS